MPAPKIRTVGFFFPVAGFTLTGPEYGSSFVSPIAKLVFNNADDPPTAPI